MYDVVGGGGGSDMIFRRSTPSSSSHPSISPSFLHHIVCPFLLRIVSNLFLRLHYYISAPLAEWMAGFVLLASSFTTTKCYRRLGRWRRRKSSHFTIQYEPGHETNLPRETYTCKDIETLENSRHSYSNQATKWDT